MDNMDKLTPEERVLANSIKAYQAFDKGEMISQYSIKDRCNLDYFSAVRVLHELFKRGMLRPRTEPYFLR